MFFCTITIRFSNLHKLLGKFLFTISPIAWGDIAVRYLRSSYEFPVVNIFFVTVSRSYWLPRILMVVICFVSFERIISSRKLKESSFILSLLKNKMLNWIACICKSIMWKLKNVTWTFIKIITGVGINS